MVPDPIERAAQQRMTPAAYDFVAGGSDDELTLAGNLEAWQRIRLRPRVLRDVSAVSTATTLLGAPLRTPVLVAPTAYQRLAHDEGERATARGAAAAGTIMIASTFATVSLSEVAEAAPGATRWFQVYIRRDREATAQLVERAAAAGYAALLFTVDVPVLSLRRRDIRNEFTLPPGMEVPNVGVALSPNADRVVAGEELEPALTFADVGWLRELSGLPVLVKGVLRGDDARACVDAGAAGIVVSNHGGRQLDTAVATADALVEVAQAVAADVPVLVDGGIRRGTDVVKALALGASAVLVGRPVVWGLATGGADGVRRVLDELTAELARALALCGARSLAEVTPDLIAKG
jgi:4-hydroxymandelate oxidase